MRMSQGAFPTPPSDRYLDDYVKGAVYEFGEIEVKEAEIISFAKQFDPQLFHIDPEAAKETIHGGLIASGWHTAAMSMRLYVEHYLPGAASLGSPGLDELRWTKAVRPGDVLSLRVTVDDVRPSRSKPDRGVLFSSTQVLNQEGELVMSMKAINLVLYREKM
jgi:acyl dehydratase